MSFFYAFLVSLCMLAWSYVYMKTYQLDAYNIGKFFNNALSLHLAYGRKNKLKFTKRLVRFILTFFICTYALLAVVFYFSSHWALIVMDSVLLILFTPVIMILVHYILYPLEILIKKYYMNKASKKLASKKCVKVGITGSFGKTSTKNILYEILSKEFKVCVTPANYNTEMGITKAILERLDDDDVFIAEMGARHKGDIEVLTKFVNPDYAVLTTIGNQHIETFSSLENIEQTKFELLKFMKKEGKAVINGDSPSNLKLFKRCNSVKFLTCVKDGFAYAENVKTSSEGSSFDMVIEGKNIPLKTRLLGQCNIDNIITAAALGYIMGISLEDIQDAVAGLEATPHRLELIKSGKINIIDDSYNSNIIGATQALNVLSCFSGRKIVVTPGFVELGEEQGGANFRLGALIADVCDYVIVMNEVNKHQILSGLISHNFNQKHIYYARTRNEQKEILAGLTCSNCTILFENDLPDNYR